jgi:intracellular sulfur oxidation DsrE/DsrF family protein
MMTDRRDFLAQLGAIASALAIDTDEMKAAVSARGNSSWDTSWIERLASARFKVVFNASDISDGAAMNYASTFLDNFHEVHDTTDAQTRPVIVFRRLGTQMAFNDVMWDRYAIGENTKINDPLTKAPARRNIFWKSGENAPPGQAESTIEVLNRRGLISLVCNYALGNWARGTAQKMNLKADDVAADARANLVAGAILVPSGIYALIRAQNAGCAYMPGT